MTLRIQCPACQRQFKVSDELRGRTVECGACENQFVVNDATVIPERDRYFPGDIKKSGLDHYARVRDRGSAPQVGFATASYNEASAADVSPQTPQRMIACALGILLQVFFCLVLLFGTQVNGLLKDMQLEKRVLLSAFIAFIGASLILYGGFRRKIDTLLIGLGLAAAVISLAIFLPVAETVEDPALLNRVPEPVDLNDEPEPVAIVPRKLTEAEAREAMGYEPVEKARANFGEEAVVALWAPTMKARFKYQIQKYLHRKTGTGERPSFYTRQDGGLIVIEGTDLGLAEIEALVERFARVEDVYPSLRVLKISIEGERLNPPSAELEQKLNDKSHESFYVHNKNELDHMDIDRVREAAQRLATAEPKRFRVEIAQRLSELLQEDGDTEYQAAICNAITVWSSPGDGAEREVAQAAQRLVIEAQEMPRSMMEFLVARKAPEVPSLLEILWKKDPTSWEPLLVDAGDLIEEMVGANLTTEERALKRSALIILRRVGTAKSLPALRQALENAGSDEEMKLLIRAAIEAIDGR